MRTLSTLLQASQDSPAMAVLHSHLLPGSQPLSLVDPILPATAVSCTRFPNKVLLNVFLLLRIFSACGSSQPSTL
ncbi:hypothetical protein AMECASPLE_025030 [Ameca splendens]|uniref:Uncharacterized protein n=1 Tax=Ameca splendens TaxID=208324 RepID=A0ABV1ABX4_9TELE